MLSGFERNRDAFGADDGNAGAASSLNIDICDPGVKFDGLQEVFHNGSKGEKCRVELGTTTSVPQEPPKSEDVGRVTLDTYLAGWKFHGGMRCIMGQVIYFLREKDNQNDPNAIQVVSGKGNSNSDILGYLPARVSQELAPLLDAEVAVLEGNVKEHGSNNNAPCELSIQILAHPAEDPEAQSKVAYISHEGNHL